MEEKYHIIAVKLEINDNKLSAIHSLEIINNIITGIYFHSYIKEREPKYNDMYYLANNQHLTENDSIQHFKKFVGNSKLIMYNDESSKIKKYFSNNIIESTDINGDLFRYARNKKINIDKKSRHGGLINCTIFGRILYEKYLNKKRMIKMTGIYTKRKYLRKKDYDEREEDTQEEDEEKENSDDEEKENNDDEEKENNDDEEK